MFWYISTNCACENYPIHNFMDIISREGQTFLTLKNVIINVGCMDKQLKWYDQSFVGKFIFHKALKISTCSII